MIKTQLDPRLKEVLNPEETAIIVVDMMDAYCYPKAPLPQYMSEQFGATFDDINKVADRIVDFIKHSRKYQIASTVFVRMVERKETSKPNIKLKMEIDNIPPVVIKDGEGWNYYKVEPTEEDHEVIKYSYSSFYKTNLHEHLQEKNVKTVIIVGVDASVCVDTTARASSEFGYHTFVPADLTVDPNMSHTPQTPEIIREKLDTINSVMGYMPLSEEIIKVWESKQ